MAKIQLPPLAKRKEDIPVLIDHFIQKFNLIKGRTIQGAMPEAIAAFFDYPFPGNIRELENIIEFAFIRCKGDWIEAEHLPDELGARREPGSEDRGADLLPHELDAALKIRSVLDRCRGNRILAAKSLGMSRSTLWRNIKKFGL